VRAARDQRREGCAVEELPDRDASPDVSEWINPKPLSLPELRGKVVTVRLLDLLVNSCLRSFLI